MEISLYGRLAYADIWNARLPKDGKGEPKFGATLIIDPPSIVRGSDRDGSKGVKQSKLINDTIKKVAKEKWKDKSEKILRLVEGDGQKFCYFEEDYTNEEGDTPDGFEDMYYLRTKSPIQPTIIDRDRTELVRADGRPYAGCYVIMKVDIWAQDNTHGKAIRAQVTGIQFFKDGDAFGGGKRAAADSFEDLSDLGDDDDAPKKRRRPADDDDEPAPKAKKRRPADDDDDEDVRPKKKRRPADDDDDIG